MADHTSNAMLAAIRSMREVVIPAVDPAHPLAREQAGLVVKYLEFWAARTDRVAERNRAELSAYVDMARAVQEPATQVSPGLAAELGAAIEAASTVLWQGDVEALRRGVTALTQLITALVRAADGSGHPAAHQIGQVVVAGTAPVALLQRAWFGPQGWEDPPPPDLDQVLTEQLLEGTTS